MSVDPYSLCPCGSGKKLKFCCTDLFHDIEKIQRMLAGDQPRAALSHVNQTLKKSPNRGSLLDMKAMIELALEELDEARATVKLFKEVDPQNPAAHAQAAILAAAQQEGAAAVGPLQDALELIAEEMPARVLQAIGAVGQSLLVAGNLIAARAHLWLYQGITGNGDTRAMDLLMRLNQMSGLPLLLRDNLYLRETPINHPAEAAHDYAQMLAARGQWRRAAEALDALCEEYPDLPMLQYNRGLVHGWIGDLSQLVEGLRAFAHSEEVSLDDAVEAEAIAQLLDTESGPSPMEVVRTTFEIKDEEVLVDRLTRNKRTDAYQLDPSELGAIEGLPPKATYMLLDKELPESSEGLTPETTPRIIGFLSHYGRQTDQEERLELVCDRDDLFAATLDSVREIGSDAVGEVKEEIVIGKSPETEPLLRCRLHFPADTMPPVRGKLLAERRRQGLLADWPTTPSATLHDKTPVQAGEAAATDSTMRLALEATLLVLEQGLERGRDASLFVELREKIGLPPRETIDAAKADFEMIPLVRLDRVDLSGASDEDLVLLFERAVLSDANEAQIQIAKIGVDRPGLAETLPAEDLFYRLVSLEPDPTESLHWLNRARDAGNAAGKSSATWDILELELCVVNGQMEDANRLVQHIREEHLEEEGVAEQLYQLLYALGAVPPPSEGPGAPSAMPAGPTGPPAGEAPGIWTPGDESPAGSSEKQKIWTPG